MQYNHPTRERLARELLDARLDPVLVACAKEFLCEVCLGRMRPKTVRVVAVVAENFFNDFIEMDVFYVRWNGKKRRVLTIMDEFSRFALDAAVKDEKAETECRALERYWIRWAGAPKVLRVDSSGGHMSQFMKDWCELRGIRLSIVPRGAHHSLAFVERHHQVRREQLAIYKKDHPGDKLKTALTWTSAVSNRMSSVNGYTRLLSMSWVLPRSALATSSARTTTSRSSPPSPPATPRSTCSP